VGAPTIAALAADFTTAVGTPEAPLPSTTVEVSGARQVLASVFDVTGFAAATVGAAGSALAELITTRTGTPAPPVRVDTRAVAAAFLSERALTPVGWTLPALLDTVSGDYATADGWIRLHTNYAHHRAAALRVLDLGPDADRDDVARCVAATLAATLEADVVAAGGAAAAMHTTAAWRDHPHGEATSDEPLLRIEHGAAAPSPRWLDGDAGRPLTGVRVLDLTRVIAGPVCTRVLAAFGADVLRIDPPGFDDIPALLPDSTAGKRCAALDLTTDDGRRAVVALLGEADVVVHGLRPGAMEGLGLGPDELAAINPGLTSARLDAYGWQGPWAARRGFDSLVQMSTGIAAAGAAAAGVAAPRPLPAQALDHGSGYLLAAAVLRALAHRARTGEPSHIRASLLATAGALLRLPPPDGPPAGPWVFEPTDTTPVTTDWGPARAAPCPVTVAGWPPRWELPAGPLGRHPAVFR
jgi:hypothetical protein